MADEKDKNLGGRPRTPDYYKIRHRYSRISKILNKYADKMVSDYDKSLIDLALAELRTSEKQVETIKNKNDEVREKAKIKARETRAARKLEKEKSEMEDQKSLEKYLKIRQEFIDSGVNFVFKKIPQTKEHRELMEASALKHLTGKELTEFQAKMLNKKVEESRRETREQLNLFYEAKEQKTKSKKRL